MPFRGPLPDVDIPHLSVHDFLFGDPAPDDLDRVALVDGASGAETSYRQLIGQIDLVAGALAARGIGLGDVVALHSPNVPAFAAVFHGILRSGATATTVNALYTGEEMGRSSSTRRPTSCSPSRRFWRRRMRHPGRESQPTTWSCSTEPKDTPPCAPCCWRTTPPPR